MVQRTDLMSDVRGISYDFETRVGRIEMAAGNACDMPGAIDLFCKIDPRVKVIETYAATTADTFYHRVGKSARWDARLPGQARPLSS